MFAMKFSESLDSCFAILKSQNNLTAIFTLFYVCFEGIQLVKLAFHSKSNADDGSEWDTGITDEEYISCLNEFEKDYVSNINIIQFLKC